MMKKEKCSICKKMFDPDEIYEYRGVLACEPHFDEAIEKRDFERAEVIAENRHITKPLEGLSFGDSVIGRANREILKGAIEAAKKEPMRTKIYEGRA